MTVSPVAAWYLADWVLLKNKRQVDLMRELGWDRARVNRIYHGLQPYGAADLATLATWLGIRPYELLLKPDEALALRTLQSAIASPAPTRTT